MTGQFRVVADAFITEKGVRGVQFVPGEIRAGRVERGLNSEPGLRAARVDPVVPRS